jgi:hypothetical protein
VDDQVLDFGHRGWLYEESFLFFDYQTDSLWVQATGEAVFGAFKGKHLDRLPATQTTWSNWLKLHPQTRALGRYDHIQFWQDSYSGYYKTGEGIKYQRHGPLHFGLAIILDAEKKLYPLAELEKQTIVKDLVGGQHVLVVYDQASRTAVAFDPKLEQMTLDFDVAGTDGEVVIQDKQTRSHWSGLTGCCTEGSSKGKQLHQLPTTLFVMENWQLHYPNGKVYKATKGH